VEFTAYEGKIIKEVALNHLSLLRM